MLTGSSKEIHSKNAGARSVLKSFPVRSTDVTDLLEIDGPMRFLRSIKIAKKGTRFQIQVAYLTRAPRLCGGFA